MDLGRCQRQDAEATEGGEGTGVPDPQPNLVRRWPYLALCSGISGFFHDERHLPAGTLDNSWLAILADALEEAGCANGELLDHLRGPGPHVRGCWAVDLCLGKS